MFAKRQLMDGSAIDRWPILAIPRLGVPAGILDINP
jgi:hypothetical protein